MAQHDGKPVLAVALDAAEPGLIRRMIDQDELPVLKSLLAAGQWVGVKAPASIGSGSVWPTFVTGTEPKEHGVYGEWCWQPETMNLRRYQGGGLVPFWKQLAEDNAVVGILDLPFMPMLGLRAGFEVSEWGPHDLLTGRLETGPDGIREVVDAVPMHPLTLDRLDSDGPHDLANLKKLTSASLEGVRLRGELAERLLVVARPGFALITFTEIHHASHYLWHAEDSGSQVYAGNGFGHLPVMESNLRDIYREVDRQIGRLIRTCGEQTRVMVFSLHGMQAAHGIPAILGPALTEWGFAGLADWRTQSWSARAISLLAAVKRQAPASLKKLYYKTVPSTTTHLLARPTMMPSYNWARTRAFSLPSDQHGWVRINLKGREAEGIVALDEYDGLCDELEAKILALETQDGQPLVRKVIRTSTAGGDALVQRLPDLVVHWEDAVFAKPLRIKGMKSELLPTGTKFTGQHALDGFCILKGEWSGVTGDVLAARDLGALISRNLEVARKASGA